MLQLMTIAFCHILQVGDSSLMEASSGGYKGIIEVLLEAGADPNITNEVKLHYNIIISILFLQY